MNGYLSMPMTVPQIIAKTFSLIRANFVRCLVLVSVVLVPVYIAVLSLRLFTIALAEGNGPVPGLRTSGASLFGILGGIGTCLTFVMLMKGIPGLCIRDKQTVRQVCRQMLPRSGTVIWAAVRVGVVVAVGLLLLVVPGIIFFLWYSVTIPVVLAEDREAVQAMWRSKSLVSGNLARTFLLLLLVAIITATIYWPISVVGRHVGQAIGQDNAQLRMLVSGAFQLAGAVLVTPITVIAEILLYYDLRIRKEGLEELAKDLGGDDTIADAPTTSPLNEQSAQP